MNSYNIVIRDSDGVQRQWGVSASSWANAVLAAKQHAGLALDASTDGNLVIVQYTGTLDVTGQ